VQGEGEQSPDRVQIAIMTNRRDRHLELKFRGRSPATSRCVFVVGTPASVAAVKTAVNSNESEIGRMRNVHRPRVERGSDRR
jgi:hypothetical protein